jgi:hypothetical protein
VAVAQQKSLAAAWGSEKFLAGARDQNNQACFNYSFYI